MGIQSFIKNLFTPDKEKKKPAGTTSQASAASGNRAVGKTIVKTPQSSGKSGGNTTKKETASAKNTNNKSTRANNKNANANNKNGTNKAAEAKTDSRRTVAAGKTAVKLPTQEQKETAKSPIAQAWKARRETVAQQQVAKAQQEKSATAKQPKIIEKFNARQQEKNAQKRAQQQAQKNRDTQLEILSSAANTYEAQLRALAGKYDRDPNRVTQADVDAYNTLLDRYKQTVANYDKASDANEAVKAAEAAAKKAKKTSAQQQLFAALGVGDTMQGAPEQENATTFDVDPRQQIINAQIAGQGAQAAAQQRAQQLPKTLAAIGLGGVAAAQDTVGTAMGLGQKAAWALSPGAQQDAAQQADHARQVAAWKQENRDAQKKMEKAFELTENDALGQFLVELNYNFVQQGLASVAGGAIGRAGGAALNAMGRSAAAAGSNMAGRIGSQAAQRAAAAEKMSGKALQGAARYLQKNAGLATMATLAGANNYEDAISGGANEGQAMAYAVLTGAAEAVTEKLFGGNPLLDNEAGWVNRALYKMLGDKKFLKALDSVPVETFNEGFEEVIANYLYSAAQAATGQKVELPSAEENLHSFALGAAMGGIGQATKALGSAMEQRSADRETGEQLRRMADPEELRRELIAAGREVPGSRADMHARELEMQQREASARELGRQYRENVQAQQAAQRQRTEQENTIRRMADAVGTRVVFDDTIRDAAGNENAANGYYKDGVLHISRDADKPAMIVAKHEITHYLQQAAPEEYRAFRTLAMSLQEEGSVPRMMERYARGGVTLTEEEAMDEIAANLAEQLMSDRGSIEGLIREKPSIAQRFFEALRNLMRKLTGQENAQLRQAEQLWIEAYKTAGSNKKTAREGGKERYMMAGRNAEGADLRALDRAKAMQRSGADMEDIRKETGWFTGADGKWRFEIDDSGMEYDGKGNFARNPDVRRYNQLFEKAYLHGIASEEELSELKILDKNLEGVRKGPLYLDEIVKHDKLFEEYPQLRNVLVRFETNTEDINGAYNSVFNEIVLRKRLKLEPEKLKNTLIHEIQHAVQDIEGFSPGSSPEYWARRDGYDKAPERVYQNRFNNLTREQKNAWTRYQELDRVLGELFLKDGKEAEYSRYEKAQDELYERLYPEQWFRDMLDAERNKNDTQSYYRELYRNTAGEIEARDAAARRTLTQKQRRETAPNTGDENTVFAENAGKSFSIGEITDQNGKSYGRGVRLDSTLLENLTAKERVQMVKERVRELGGQHFTAYDSNGKEVDVQIATPEMKFINKSGKRTPVNKDLTTKKSKSRVKQEAVVLADELIATAKYDKHSAARYTHGWLDNNGRNDWAQWKTYVQDKENTVWEATLHIATSADGKKILYDIDPIKKTGRSGKSDAIPVKDIIRNGGSDVNKKFSLKEDERKREQLEIIQKNNAAADDYHTWIRSVDDIHTLRETLNDPEWSDYDEFNPDYTKAMAEQALRDGEIEVFSSYPIKAGVFVTPSRMEAESYSGNGKVYSQTVAPEDVAWIDPTQGQFAPVGGARYSLKEDSEGRKLAAEPKGEKTTSAADLKAMRRRRSDVRSQIEKLEWLEEKQGGKLDVSDATEMQRLRKQEKALTERIDKANAMARENRAPAYQQVMERATAEAAQAQPTQAQKTLRQDLLDTFSVQAGRRKELGQAIDTVAERVRKQGYATASDGAELFRGLYNAGVVVDTTRSENYAEARRALNGVKLHIPAEVRAELGDDLESTRRQAFRNGIALTTKDGEGIGIDVEYKEMAELFPGLFDSYNTDRTKMLDDMISTAELGRPEHISLMEQAIRAGGEDAVAQQMAFFDKYLGNALENYAKQAGFEVRVKQGEIMRAAKSRAAAAEAWEKQSQRAAMAEAQNKALKVLQRLRRMRPEQNAATQKLIDEIVGDFDTMAKTLRKDKEASWRDLKAIYEEQRIRDPNFLPNESWEKKFDRLNAARVGELSREEAMELYNTGVELIHMIRTKDKEIAAENARNLTDLYRAATGEINSSEGSKYEYSRTMRGKEKIKGAAHQYWNKEQLSPMNMIEKMGGWRRDGAFYSMAKQLERGEYNKQKYTIEADALLKDFTEKHADWIAKADGKGKNAIWYEVEVPAFTERGNGGADLRSGESVKIYMTPAMKVKLYLDSLSNDNLRHIEYGGATFPDKALYAAGDEAAAYARGVTVKMQPGVVKNLVKDLTPEERELADIIGRKYFNGMAKEELNRISNLLDGHDKAISKNYSPIYTNANYLGKSADPAIVDATLEGMGPLKKRVWSGKPALAVSALTAFEKHRNMAAKYVGLAIPVRNMNALLNYTEPGYVDSMRDVISRKWGKTAVQYLDDLLVEIQNKPVAETTIVDDVLNGAISNYVKAVFGFNPGTVLKQAPGYFMAGARLGFDTMPKTSMLHSAWGKYRDLIAKYTPLMEWRARGYSSREMAELKNNPSWTQKNRAFRFVFGGAIQWMDLHTCAAIWPWAENYVKKNYPDLKPGSRAEINKGTDPFYKKVAEVFEDAIANSQPMYDDMHTAKILHTNRGVLRGLTMFHSAQLTQANAIRQAHGELKRAQQEKDQAGVKKGQRALLNSIMALLVSTLGFEAVGALVAMAKRKDKALRNEDGKMTAESVGKYLADATAKDLLGNVVGWDTAYDLGKHVFFGDTWYGFETPGLDAIGDFIDDAAKTKKAVTEFSGGLADVTDKGDFTYYLKTAGGEVRKNVKNLAMDLSYLVGVPAKNMESYILGVMGWVNPELAAEYNNAVGGGYSRNSVEALQGKPEEQKAAIAQAVRNRAKDASDEAVSELQRLYATAGTEILPAAVSGSITIQTGEDTSEQVKLTLKQKSDYQKAYDAVVSDALNKMIASGEYQKLSDDQKAGAVVTLYKYAAEQGKRAAVAEYAPKGWTAKAEQATKEGASVEQIAIYKAATAEIEGDKDEDGKTVTGSRNKKIYDALEGMHFGEEAKSAIYKASVDDVGEDQGYQQAKNAGVTDWQYITFRANTGVITSDKDEDGKTISGTKKKKVLDYIDSMDVDAAAKDALYYAAGYKESTIDDAPWRGGSVKTGSTGTRKSKSKRTRKSSGGTKKAAKAAAKRQAAQQALASPAVQEYLNRYAGGAGLDSVYRYINKFGNGGRMLGDYRVGDLPRAGEVQMGRDLPRAGEEVPVRDLPTYADLVAQRKAAEESLDEKWYRKYGRR